MLVGTLALTGFPLTAGYYSKDLIVEAAYVGDNPFALYAFVMLVAAAVLTAFYSWRLIFMAFHGQTRASAETYKHAHESPATMLVPLGVLVAGSALAGGLFVHQFEGEGTGAFWNGALFTGSANTVLHDLHNVATWVVLSPTIALIVGFAIAFAMYVWRPALPQRFIAAAPAVHRFFLNKWYFDELYEVLFVRPARALGRLFWSGDRRVIDGAGPDGIAARVRDLAVLAHRFQSGYLYHYAFVMLTGIAILVTVMIALDRGYF
jgi:NADH-quinone oxidoreductase subunit L